MHFTTHPDLLLVAIAAVLIGAGLFWPGPGSALSWLVRRRRG